MRSTINSFFCFFFLIYLEVREEFILIEENKNYVQSSSHTIKYDFLFKRKEKKNNNVSPDFISFLCVSLSLLFTQVINRRTSIATLKF